MKVKVEFDITPEEFQDLFVPSDKQKEFAQAFFEAYALAMANVAKMPIDKFMKRFRGESSDVRHDS